MKVITQRSFSASPVVLHLQQIATNYRLRLARDECGDPVILGKGGHLYAYDDSFLAVLVSSSSKRAWTHARKKLVAAGLTLLQDCDIEGTARFDPLNPQQAKVAIHLAGVKKRRCVTPETKAKLASFSRARQSMAGKPLPAVGASSGRRTYISAGCSQIRSQNGSPATNPVESGGAE
jgi:hypothetical protein